MFSRDRHYRQVATIQGETAMSKRSGIRGNLVRLGAATLTLALVAVGPASAAHRVPLLWQTETTEGYEIAAAVASGDDRIASVGNHYSPTCTPGVGCGIDASLRVHDARTGALEWVVNFDLSGTLDVNQAVAIANGTVITAGYSRNITRTFGHDWWVVSAFALDTGALLWRDVVGDATTDHYPWQIVVKNGRAYVTGIAGATCSTVDSTTCDQFVRVYDIASGAVVWTLREDPSGGGDDETLSIAVAGRVMVVGGSVGAGTDPAIDPTVPEVRAYDIRTKQLLWRDVMPDSSQHGFVFKVAADEDRVVAAAIASDNWLVRAYDARTGHILWSRTFSRTGMNVPGMYDAPVQMVLSEDTVLVGGYGSTQVFGTEAYPKASRDWVVRAYNAETGKLLWADVSGSPTDTDEVNGGVVISGGRAYALGFVADANGEPHTLVRAYELRTGRIVWEDTVERGGFPFGVTITLAASGHRLTAASYVQGTRPDGTPPPASYGYDLLLRTYRIKGDEEDGHGHDHDHHHQHERDRAIR
jgi:glucose dehydrogenase